MKTSACLGQFLWCASAGRLRPAKQPLAARLAEQLRARGRYPLLISCDDYYRCGWVAQLALWLRHGGCH